MPSHIALVRVHGAVKQAACQTNGSKYPRVPTFWGEFRTRVPTFHSTLAQGSKLAHLDLPFAQRVLGRGLEHHLC